MVAVRAFGHFTKDPASWWYGKSLMQPELDGWWQVFSLDGRAYPDGPGGEQISRAEARAVAAVAREHGGFADGGATGRLETMRTAFNTVGLVHRGEPGPLPTDAATVIAPAQEPPLSVVEPRPAPTKPVTLLGLDTVAWGRYEHAYGPADDVPDLLRALAANDDDWDDVLGELCDAVFHQGTCYSATALVVPWLARLAADPAVSAVRRLRLLVYLCDMAVAADSSAVYLADRARATNTPAVGREEEDTRRAVEESVAPLLARWAEESEAARLVLAALAASFPADDTDLGAVIEAEAMARAGTRTGAGYAMAAALVGQDHEAVRSQARQAAVWLSEDDDVADDNDAVPAAVYARLVLSQLVEREIGRSLSDSLSG